ncbi:hypothetical protein A2U01_0062998, partial [Trifolium medium]|nr:hypothetical protein [Trifolium medium]
MERDSKVDRNSDCVSGRR